MKKSFMTRVLAVSLSAAMAFSMSSASNLMTASAASTVNLKTTFKTLKVNQTYKMTLKNNTLNWKITKVTTSNKAICTVYGKTASSVMLKGKGVGRAKITVKVKTTKRKYPKNIKNMKCTAKVVAADPNQGQTTDTFSATATASSNTEVNVKFTQAIDGADIPNFTVSDNVQVTGVKLSDDKMTAVLTVAGAEYGKKYDLTVTGIKVAGKEQAEQKLTFEVPASTVKYPASLETDKELLTSNGADQTVVTFTIKDKDGNLIQDKGVEVAFSADLGTFATPRVTLQNGQATVVYTAPTLMETYSANLVAKVVESTDNHELLDISASKSIKLSPTGKDTSIGAIITSVTAPTADRVYAYFNQEVHAADFLKAKSKKLDRDKFEARVYSGVDNDNEIGTTLPINVVGVLDVPGEEKALQLLVSEPMQDNSNIVVSFKNKTNSDSVNQWNTVSCKLTDARQPSVLNVATNDNSDITVKFSEAVLLTELCTGGISTPADDIRSERLWAADNPSNYKIDGIPLSELGVVIESTGQEAVDDTTSEVKRLSKKDSSFDVAADRDGKIQGGKYEKAEDKRDEVTIKLGIEAKTRLAAGDHTLTISNVGDWAAKTDLERNILVTQEMKFNVKENNETPSFTVEPQSPEQYKVVFNHPFALVDANSDTVKTPNSIIPDRKSIFELQQWNGSSWETISDTNGNGKNPIRVSKVEGETYVVEVTEDWTNVYNTSSTKKNYYNYQLRLHIDADRIYNLANGKRNAALDVNLDQDIMRKMDAESPVIGEVERATDTNDEPLTSWNITFNEPVKMSTNANEEGLTPSQTQASYAVANDNQGGVPAPSAQFINADNSKTVDGYITTNYFIDAYDQVINVEPITALDPGKWRIVVSSISDDYGNTASTVVRDIEIPAESSSTDFKIVWAAVGAKREYNPNEMGTAAYPYGRFIYVKFNKPINLVGNSANALTHGNYSIDGDTAPAGTNVYAKIKGYDDDVNGLTDSITIELPERKYGTTVTEYQVDARNTVLNVSRAITSQTGDTLSGETHIKLPYHFGMSDEYSYPELLGEPSIQGLRAETDAVWGNRPGERFDGLTPERYYEELKKALEDDKYRKVVLTGNLDLGNDKVQKVFGKSGVLKINRAVDIVIPTGVTITGNVEVSTENIANDITFSGGGIIDGRKPNDRSEGTAALTVNTKNAGFVNQGVVIDRGTNDYAVNINDVCVGTFTNNGRIVGDINVTDPNGASFDAALGSVEGSIFISSTGDISLIGELSKIKEGIFVTGAATVDLEKADLSAGVDGKVAITVSASNARIIIGERTTTDGSAVIVAEVKDVKITLPRIKVGGVNFVKGANGSFVAVTKANRPVTTGTDDAVTITEAAGADGGQVSKLAAVIAKLDVVTGTVLGTDAPTTVTRGAITGDALTLATSDKLEKAVKAEIPEGDSDGVAINKISLKVSYKLSTRNGLAVEGDTIKVTNKDAAKPDYVTVTIQVYKYGKLTNEIKREMTFTN